MTITPLTFSELRDIGNSLDDYHAIHYKFWTMSRVSYDDEIPTAAVLFHPDLNPEMRINKEFWSSLNHRSRLFVVGHECLHVILEHQDRNGWEVPGATRKKINMAQDITINEMMVSIFGFNRNDLQHWEKYCWIDTCFKEPKKVLRDQSFTYYLELLIEQDDDNFEMEIIDVHGYGSNGPPCDTEGEGGTGSKGNGDHDPEIEDPAITKKKQQFIQDILDDMTQGELEKLQSALPKRPAGSEPSVIDILIHKKRRKVKLKFSSIIKNLKKSRFRREEVIVDSFVNDSRRFTSLMTDKSLVLPGKHPVVKMKKERLLTALFMDISGSCMDFLDEFAQVFTAFQEEEKIFETRSFTFDTRVKEVDPLSKIKGGGGTAFDIIEEKVQELTVEYGKYPDCVIVITDGYGDPVTPAYPKQWIWLLTDDTPCLSYIDPVSRRHLLSEIILKDVPVIHE